MGRFQNRIGCFIKNENLSIIYFNSLIWSIFFQFGSNLGLNILKFVQNHKYEVKTQVLQYILKKNRLFYVKEKICLYFFIYFLIISSVKTIVLRSGQEIILCAWKAVLNFILLILIYKHSLLPATSPKVWWPSGSVPCQLRID